ncbi:hypothetical protein HN937_24545 [Candidatus Poribacteria bacterium]|jgi:hypothetical protein|nr:hypothetical protein [Candidatus Poribacteria bacterium]
MTGTDRGRAAAAARDSLLRAAGSANATGERLNLAAGFAMLAEGADAHPIRDAIARAEQHLLALVGCVTEAQEAADEQVREGARLADVLRGEASE